MLLLLFQSKINPIFSSFRDRIKAWLDEIYCMRGLRPNFCRHYTGFQVLLRKFGYLLLLAVQPFLPLVVHLLLLFHRTTPFAASVHSSVHPLSRHPSLVSRNTLPQPLPNHRPTSTEIPRSIPDPLGVPSRQFSLIYWFEDNQSMFLND